MHPKTDPAPAPAESAPAPTPAPRSTPENEHRYDIDLLRLIGSCAVIFTHVSAAFIGEVGNEESNGRSAYWIGHIGDAASSFAVPLFFAIGGWTVVMGAPPRNEARMWQRIRRNGLPLFVWTAAYIAWGRLRDTNDDPASDLALDGVFGSVQPAYHLWFMYAYIPITMLFAFLVLMRSGQRPWGLGIALAVIAGAPSLVSTVGEVTGWTTPTVGWGFGTYSVVYAAVGALILALPNGLPPRYRPWVLAALLLTVAGCVWYDTRIHYVIPNAHPFVALMTLAVLVLVLRLRVPERWRPRLKQVAGAALGAYLVHIFFVEELVRRMISPDMGPADGTVLLVVTASMTIALSYAVSLLWGRFGLRRFLG
ncbi:acyltransferase [Streptomyces specialis]|uniref:acyltransferase n=1 Tax=Streptomyces specialis TaxID=498367 RepID=UPI00073F9152|nr:acyltransferase [Streptomyces specialis]